MVKILKIIGKGLLYFVGFILFYMFSAYCLARITIKREADTKEEVAMYILTNGVHTDLVVPAKNELMDWTQEIKPSNTVAADTSLSYLSIGWGDKGFYLETPKWADLKVSTAFKAAFGLSTTALHTTYYKSLAETQTCKKIVISKEQYSRLVGYILSSLRKDANGHAQYIKTSANYGKTDAFYEATGSYSMLHTCNTWANNGLKTAGQKCCLWTPFDTGIFLKYN
jgi:uncharacterized protein (TIGR02117 family)